MIRKTIIVGIIVFNLFSCSIFRAPFLSQKEIVELNNEYQEIIFFDKEEKSVHYLYLKIVGNIDGEIEIEYGDGAFFKKITISKENNKHSYYIDYYSNILILKIYPKTITGGKLKIKYYFIDSF